MARARREGLLDTIRYASSVIKDWIHYFAYDRYLDRLEVAPTSGAIDVDAADVVGPVPALQYRRYHALARLPLLWALRTLRLDHSSYTFIDFGSGRGRALLTAARLPFEEVIGIEFSGSLHRQALDNIACYPDEKVICRQIDALHLNAIDFAPPDDKNFVAFFFNPFSPEVLDRVADHLERASLRLPRSRFVIFANSNRLPLFRDRPAFHRLRLPLLSRIQLRWLSPVPVELFRIDHPAGGSSPRSITGIVPKILQHGP